MNTTDAILNVTALAGPAGGPFLSPWEQAFLTDFNKVVNHVIGAVIIAFGLLGNVLSIVILTRPRMRYQSTNHYLAAMAVWDCIVLISSVFLLVLTERDDFMEYHTDFFPYAVPVIYPVALTGQMATIYITVAVTVERYIAVCHPFKASLMCTVRRARIVILSVSLGAVIYNVPRCLEIERVASTVGNVTRLELMPGSVMKNDSYTRYYFNILYIVVMGAVPLTSLCVLNTFLIRAVKKSQKQQREVMNVKQSVENNVTIMLIAVVIVFIVCQIPALVYMVVFGIQGNNYITGHFGYSVLSILRNALAVTNSAINFILYCTLGKKFRDVFLATFCPCLPYVRNAQPRFTIYKHSGAPANTKNMAAIQSAKKYARYLKNKSYSSDAVDRTEISHINGTPLVEQRRQQAADENNVREVNSASSQADEDVEVTLEHNTTEDSFCLYKVDIEHIG